jgi:putative phosphoesterase
MPDERAHSPAPPGSGGVEVEETVGVYGAPDRLVRVGLLGDTHVPDKAASIPGAVLRAFEGVDVILHAGDLITLSVLDILGNIAPVEAVYGNNDPFQVAERLSSRLVVQIGGARVGLVHGHRGAGRNTPDRAARSFHGPLDAVVFGHSHLPLIVPPGTSDPYSHREQPLPFMLINPGSPTDRRHAARRSFALMEVEGSEVRARLVWL